MNLLIVFPKLCVDDCQRIEDPVRVLIGRHPENVRFTAYMEVSRAAQCRSLLYLP
jgi:hypothetical protein